MKKTVKNWQYILILSVIYLILSIFFYSKTANMFVDFHRECYIPYSLLNEKALIKDIFLIYGPFGYIINAIIYKLFGVNINYLIIEAHIISYVILIFFYYISQKFLKRFFCFILSLFFILISIFSNSTFSFVLPYSYSSIYAVMGVFGLFYSLLYNKKPLIFLFLGLIFVNRIEYFIFCFFIILYFIFSSKKKEILKYWQAFFIFPLIVLVYFLKIKLNLSDVIYNFSYLQNMLNSDTLKTFYKSMGGFFEFNYFKYNLSQSALFFLIGALSYIFYFYKQKTLSIITLFLILFINSNSAFSLICIINIILTIYFIYKKRLRNKEFLLFLFSTTLLSKSLFCVSSLNYGNFGYFLAILYFYILFKKILADEDKRLWLENLFLIFFIINFSLNFINYLTHKKYPIQTNVGKIYLTNDVWGLYGELNKFLGEITKNNEDFLILPEGLMFNLIYKMPYNFYNTSFIPLDFETFKQEKLINDLKNNYPKYIIITPRNTLEYGKKTICRDYGLDFCMFIDDNYYVYRKIQSRLDILILKLKQN